MPVTAGERGGDQGDYLVSRICPPRDRTKVNVSVDQFPQAEMLREREVVPGLVEL